MDEYTKKVIDYKALTNKANKDNKSCPICKRIASTQYYPFCSLRCKDADLGNWVTGKYYIAADSLGLEDRSIANDENQTTLL